MIVLGIDSGLATFGVSAVRLSERGVDLVDVGVFTSAPSAKKLEVKAAADLERRARELATYLDVWFNAHQPIVVCLEAPSWPRNAGAAAKMGTAFGVVYAAAHRARLPVVQVSPQDVKLALCRRKNAAKEDVIGAVERLHPDVCWPTQTTLWEHAADAIGVVHASLDAGVIRMARRLSA